MDNKYNDVICIHACIPERGNYMNITLESHLKEVSKEEGNKLYSNWMVIKEELCSKLETVSSYFQHFSLHNSTHSKETSNRSETATPNDITIINNIKFTSNIFV